MPRDFLSDASNGAPINEKPIFQPRDFLAEPEKESKLASVALALPRLGEDIKKAGYHAIRQVPGFYESAKTEIPGFFNLLLNNPELIREQGHAGLAELGHNTFNLPHNIVNYLSDRLHLVSEDFNKKIQMARMPEDTQEMINTRFGEPQYAGEKLARGLSRNSLNLGALTGITKILNPLQLTNKGISKKVVNELNNQVGKHTKMYNALWNQAEKKGFNQVPFDSNALINDFDIIKKSYTPKQYKSITDFLGNPTLEHAQSAQSDLGVLRRAIEEKSKTTPLLEGEKNIYEALSRSENNIESNMFKNQKGELNNKLQNQYKKISKSYRENVVPYKYNADIQDYIGKDITAKQLIQRLNQGPFAAKKGGFLTHPQFGIRNALLPLLGGIGVLGGGKYLLDQALGNNALSKNYIDQNR